jgi:Uma2 family endonuclease
MTVDARLMTAEDLLEMPDDGMLHELVNGELLTMTPAKAAHGKIGMAIAFRLAHYVDEHRLGATFTSDTGFVLSRNPDTVRTPDASFVRAERNRFEDEFFPGAPDLAVEVISPNDRYTEVAEKVGEYLAAGSQMVVVVDPRTRTATVHTPAGIHRLSIDETLDGGDVVPGWRLSLRDIFET